MEISTLLTGGLCSLLILRKILGKGKKDQKQKRRVSFQSAAIAMNCMPDSVNLRNPTINIIMTCDKLPKLEDIANVIKTMFQYHRMASVPIGKDGDPDWSFEKIGPIDPLNMVRELKMKCDTKEEWAEVVQEQQKQSIRRIDLPWWEFVLMNNEGAGDHVLLFRIDHSVADGLSLGKIFTSVIQRNDGSTMSSLIPPSMISNKEKVDSKVTEMILKTPKAILDVSLLPLGKIDDPIYLNKNVVGHDVVSEIRPTIL